MSRLRSHAQLRQAGEEFSRFPFPRASLFLFRIIPSFPPRAIYRTFNTPANRTAFVKSSPRPHHWRQFHPKEGTVMSFTENPRSALCSAGVCCGTCGVEAELEAYAPLVRSVARRYAGRSPSRSPTARKNINRSGVIPLRLYLIYAGCGFPLTRALARRAEVCAALRLLRLRRLGIFRRGSCWA